MNDNEFPGWLNDEMRTRIRKFLRGYANLNIGLVLTSISMLFMSIWIDWRWFLSGALLLVISIFSLAIQGAVSKEITTETRIALIRPKDCDNTLIECLQEMEANRDMLNLSFYDDPAYETRDLTEREAHDEGYNNALNMLRSLLNSHGIKVSPEEGVR